MTTCDENEGQNTESLGSEYLYDNICQPCHGDGKTLEAVGLCLDCQEYLCQRCFDFHKLPTPCRNHKLLNKEQILQSGNLETRKDKCTEKCAHHDDEIITYYCTNHSFLGCHVCITLDHRSCDGVHYIPQVAKDLANDKEYQAADTLLKSVTTKSKEIIQKASQKIVKTEKDYMEVVQTVRNFRNEINEALDKIESRINQKAEIFKSEECKKVASISDKCRVIHTEVQDITTQIEETQNKKHYCQLYTAMMKAKSRLQALEEKLNEEENEETLKECQFQFQPSKELLETLKDHDALGKLCMGRMNPMTGPRLGPIVKLEQMRDIDVKTSADKATCRITGSVTLSGNQFLLADRSNGNLKVLESKLGQISDQIKLPSVPWDIAIVTSGQAAVTLPNEKKIAFVQVVPTLSIDRTIRVNGNCYGVAHSKGQLVVSFYNPDKVEIMDLQGVVHNAIATDKQGQALFSAPHYLAISTDTNTMYVSNFNGNNVVCLKFDGTVVARYTDSGLKCPLKVVVDSSNMVYVCGRDSHNIHQMTKDCSKVKVLLTSADGLDMPYSISFSESGDNCVVGMFNNNNVKVFNVIRATK